jgi:uncharacterized membrane protein required for colicin V production
MEAIDLTVPDMIVLGLCAVLGVRGAMKGFTWQLVRTIGLIAALWAATRFYGPVGTWIDGQFPVPSFAAPMIAWVAVVVGVFLTFKYLAHVVKGAVKSVNMGGIDRALGFVLGAVMGLAFSAAGFVIWGHTAGEDELLSTLEGSVSARFMAQTVDVVKPLFPEEMRTRFRKSLDALDAAAAAESEDADSAKKPEAAAQDADKPEKVTADDD